MTHNNRINIFVYTPYVCKLKNYLLKKSQLGRGIILIVRRLVIFYQRNF